MRAVLKRGWFAAALAAAGSLAGQASPPSAGPQPVADAVDPELLAFIREIPGEWFYAVQRRPPVAASEQQSPEQHDGWLSFRYDVRLAADPPVAVYVERSCSASAGYVRHREVAYELRDPGSVVWARDRLRHGVGVATVELQRTADGAMSRRRSDDGEVLEDTIAPLADTLREQLAAHRALLARRRSATTVHVVDLLQEPPEREGTMSFRQEVEHAEWGKVLFTELAFDDGKQRCFYDANGVLKWWAFGEWIGVAAAQRAAQAVGGGAHLPVYLELPRSQAIAAMTLVWRDCAIGDWPRTPTQSWRRRGDGAIEIELRQEQGAGGAVRALSAPERQHYLAATDLLEVGDARIAELAAGTVGDERDVAVAAQKLVDGVRARLDARMTMQIRSALAALAAGDGDCKDHAVLFVALARAAGIPARLVQGFAYGGERPRNFGLHLWAEVHDGRQWVGVDPFHDVVRLGATYLAWRFDSTQDMPEFGGFDLTIESLTLAK